MSSTGTQPARQGANDQSGKRALSRNRSPMAHLLHALNQPLTGLQCSLELAVANPRGPEQHLRTLRDALELTVRMRILVEAMREIADVQEGGPQAIDADPNEPLRLDALLREAADDLGPVAEARNLHLRIAAKVALPVLASRRQLAPLLFRFLESAVSMAREGSDVDLTAEPERGQAVLSIAWNEASAAEHSAFSPPELGLLIAQVGWERVGATWLSERAGQTRTCTIRLPLAFPETGAIGGDAGELP